jgi:predicted Zn-dependent protease
LVWNISGDLQLQAGDPDLAIEHLETSMRLDPLGPDRATQARPMGCALYAQGRFREALAYFRELVQQQENPGGYFLLAAALGHLGPANAAEEALAHYRALTPLSPAEFAQNWSRTVRPEFIRQWLDGIALAEGKRAPDGPAAH